jgi:hypothetical protein
MTARETVRERLLHNMPDDAWIEINRLIIMAEVWPSDARLEIDRMQDEEIIDVRLYGGRIECRRVPA